MAVSSRQQSLTEDGRYDIRLYDPRSEVPPAVVGFFGGKNTLVNWHSWLDGSETRRSPVEGKVVEIPLFTREIIHAKWLFGISEPSTVAMENGPGLKMYFLLNMGMFQPAMLVYQRVLFLKMFYIFLSSVFPNQRLSHRIMFEGTVMFCC